MSDGATEPAVHAADLDQDRGFAAGVWIGLAMFVGFQLVTLATFHVARANGGSFFLPLKYAGITQLLYVVPSTLLFVNRMCPRQAIGAAALAGVVLLGTVVALLVG